MAEKDWKYAAEKKDINLGIKGLDESVRFIVEMAMEGSDNTKEPTCAALHKEGVSYKDIQMMVKVLKNPKTTLQADKEGHMMFNGHNFDEAGKYMAESLFKGDFGKMGWLFAASMDKELNPSP